MGEPCTTWLQIGLGPHNVKKGTFREISIIWRLHTTLIVLSFLSFFLFLFLCSFLSSRRNEVQLYRYRALTGRMSEVWKEGTEAYFNSFTPFSEDICEKNHRIGRLSNETYNLWQCYINKIIQFWTLSIVIFCKATFGLLSEGGDGVQSPKCCFKINKGKKNKKMDVVAKLDNCSVSELKRSKDVLTTEPQLSVCSCT
jgi:hypothetical protein